MNLTPFKLDIDELINEFSEVIIFFQFKHLLKLQGNSKTLADMKRVWLSRKFSFIYEASPSTNLAFFMQSLYAHSIGHMVSTASLSHRLGGLYCLYCLYETQPFKPPFKIYLSLGELKRLKNLVVDAKEEHIKVVPALIKRMLERNMLLFGFVDINEGSLTERVQEITNLQNAHMHIAYEKYIANSYNFIMLLANTRIEHFLHMDLGMELDLKLLKKMSTEYEEAKELAIKGTFLSPFPVLFSHSFIYFLLNCLIFKEAGDLVDVQNIKHITENKKVIGDVVEKIAEDWNIQKEVFNQQTGFYPCPNEEQEEQVNEEQEQEEVNGGFDKELEQLLSLP
ncbi:hypothetical protein HHK36_025818 [Tetracentron sinense]|uniref:Uncharacterized protein n=1 Tax=Tetracentron sinense TaxID=13715 RepID=A0A835D5X8_TETSI|nr:hypothetical protein HHK36_025818 [Tetracentron sinense]